MMENSNKKVVAAIDLGYGHTKFAKFDDSGSMTVDSFPSFVGVGASGKAGLETLGSLDVVSVNLAGNVLTVGKDSANARGAQMGRNTDEGFSSTPQYAALMMGALAYLDLPRIDVLVIGLPMHTLRANSAQLRERYRGTHDVPMLGNRKKFKRETVEIGEVIVVGQPVGALMDACANRPDIQDDCSIVLDMGFHTLDVLGMEARKPRADRVDGIPGGVSGYINAVSESVRDWFNQQPGAKGAELRLPIHQYETALRTGKPMRTGIGPIDLSQHRAQADATIAQYLDKVASIIKDYGDITVAVLAGGGAKLIEAPFKARFPLIRNVMIPDEPNFSVVRGFLHVAKAQASRGVAHA